MSNNAMDIYEARIRLAQKKQNPLESKLYELRDVPKDMTFVQIGENIRNIFEKDFEGKRAIVPKAHFYNGIICYHLSDFSDEEVTAVSYNDMVYDNQFSLAGKKNDITAIANTVAEKINCNLYEINGGKRIKIFDKDNKE